MFQQDPAARQAAQRQQEIDAAFKTALTPAKFTGSVGSNAMKPVPAKTIAANTQKRSAGGADYKGIAHPADRAYLQRQAETAAKAGRTPNAVKRCQTKLDSVRKETTEIFTRRDSYNVPVTRSHETLCTNCGGKCGCGTKKH